MADKTFSVTLKDPLLKDITQVCLSPQADGSVTVSAAYALKDSTGAVYLNGQVQVALGTTAKNSLVTWLNANILPVIRQQEGL